MHSLNYATLVLLSGKEANTVSQQTDSVGQTIKALDGLKTAASTHAIQITLQYGPDVSRKYDYDASL